MEVLQQKPCCPQSLKYVPSGLYRKFTDLCVRHVGTHTPEQAATLGGNRLIPKTPLRSSLSPLGEATHFFEHLGMVNLPPSRVDKISGPCPRFSTPKQVKGG